MMMSLTRATGMSLQECDFQTCRGAGIARQRIRQVRVEMEELKQANAETLALQQQAHDEAQRVYENHAAAVRRQQADEEREEARRVASEHAEHVAGLTAQAERQLAMLTQQSQREVAALKAKAEKELAAQTTLVMTHESTIAELHATAEREGKEHTAMVYTLQGTIDVLREEAANAEAVSLPDSKRCPGLRHCAVSSRVCSRGSPLPLTAAEFALSFICCELRSLQVRDALAKVALEKQQALMDAEMKQMIAQHEAASAALVTKFENKLAGKDGIIQQREETIAEMRAEAVKVTVQRAGCACAFAHAHLRSCILLLPALLSACSLRSLGVAALTSPCSSPRVRRQHRATRRLWLRCKAPLTRSSVRLRRRLRGRSSC